MEARIFDALGFSWDRVAVATQSVHTVERAVWRYHRSLPEFVWDAAVLEGNPFTFPEVQTLMDGITVGGRKLSDERQVVNLAEAARELARLVRSGEFRLDKETSDRLHYLIARDEALEAGQFRGEGTLVLTPGVSPARGLEAIQDDIAQPFEQAVAYFLFGSLQQFYFDGNKRTARSMNGHLMSCGIDAISVPAARRLEFNTGMVEFFRMREATGMFRFLTSCHADFEDSAAN